MNTFDYRGANLRALTIDGQSWFHATDVCRILGLNVSKGVFVHTSRLGIDEKRLVKTPSSARGQGKAPQFTAVSESGLYKLILRSDKPEAREFQDWVTREVLPSIRRTGGNGSFLRLADYPSLLEGGDMEGVSP
jgi:prophage antirepressor-like protein